MSARYFILTVTILIFTLIFLSCKSDTVTNTGQGLITSLDTTDFKFPFVIGNSWSYIQKIYADDIRPDSILPYFANYPLTFSGTMSILYDTVINNITTRCFLEVPNPPARTNVSRRYLINNDTALLLYASRGVAFFGLPPKDFPAGEKKMTYPLDENTLEELHIFDPPYALLKYPVVTGKGWKAEYGGPSDTVLKRYEGYELIANSSGTFKCMKTSAALTLFPEVIYYDYYCKYGLLKRHIFYNDVVITTIWYPEGIGYADITDIYSVTSFNIP